MFLVCAASLAGCAIGVAAWVLKWLVASVSRVSVGFVAARAGWWIVLLLPLAGIMVAGFVQRRVLRRTIYHGVDRLRRAFAERSYRMPADLVYSPVLLCAVTLGTGGSAGAEGPIAYTGAAIGSNLGRWLGVPKPMMRALVSIGAGAGIAAIFKAPVGGALFTLECLGVGAGPATALALLAACVCSWGTVYALTGFSANVSFPGYAPFEWHWLPALLLLGGLCGVYSFYYRGVTRRARGWLAGMSSPLARNVASGCAVGALVFLFPSLYGEGYGVIGQLLGGDAAGIAARSPLGALPWPGGYMLPVICGAILIVKALATTATNSGGGVAGDFAPTLFAGALGGYLFAAAAGGCGAAEVPVACFACYGMAGVMAGAAQAPFMAMFIVAEMTGEPGTLMPCAITAAVSYGVTRLMARLPGALTKK